MTLKNTGGGNTDPTWQSSINQFIFQNVAGVKLTLNTGTAVNECHFEEKIGVGAIPHASAKLAVDSTTLGFLPPRMNTTARDNISSPAAGLIIYNTSTSKLNVFTTVWEAVTSA